jgi:hypothetical protein
LRRHDAKKFTAAIDENQNVDTSLAYGSFASKNSAAFFQDSLSFIGVFNCKRKQESAKYLKIH